MTFPKSEDRSRAETQALVDAAHLCRLLAVARDEGLLTGKGVVNVDDAKCNEILEEGENVGIVPRHDLLKPARLLTELRRLNEPNRVNLPPTNEIVATFRLVRMPRQALYNFQPLWQVVQESADNNLPDIGVCDQGIVARVQGAWYLLNPPDLYTAVAEAYGLPIQKQVNSNDRRNGRGNNPFDIEF